MTIPTLCMCSPSVVHNAFIPSSIFIGFLFLLLCAPNHLYHILCQDLSDFIYTCFGATLFCFLVICCCFSFLNNPFLIFKALINSSHTFSISLFFFSSTCLRRSCHCTSAPVPKSMLTGLYSPFLDPTCQFPDVSQPINPSSTLPTFPFPCVWEAD